MKGITVVEQSHEARALKLHDAVFAVYSKRVRMSTDLKLHFLVDQSRSG